MELLLLHRELRLHRGVDGVGEEVERAGAEDGADCDKGLVGLGSGSSKDVDVMSVGKRDTKIERREIEIVLE
jgi:hypothetical protein